MDKKTLTLNNFYSLPLTYTHDCVYHDNMKLSFIKKLQYFQDLATSIRQGLIKSDRRVQLKMPNSVVTELDKQFPDVDRSHLITQLAIDLITQKLKLKDRSILMGLKASEQSSLDDMLNYLEDREIK